MRGFLQHFGDHPPAVHSKYAGFCTIGVKNVVSGREQILEKICAVGGGLKRENFPLPSRHQKSEHGLADLFVKNTRDSEHLFLWFNPA